MALKLGLNLDLSESNPTDFTKFGYRMLDILTPGQFGKTYVVEDLNDPDLKTWVAKSVDLSQLTGKEKSNCKLEADILMALDHPTILKCKETFMKQDCLVLILEHMKGGDFEDHMKGRRDANQEYSEEELRTIMSLILEALDYLHVKQKIIHRDIKPGNLLLRVENDLSSLVIADFGISKMMNNTLALAQTHIGTPAYMSPEMLRGQTVDLNGNNVEGYSFGSDLWALGCVMWELAEGKPMYDAQSIGNLVHMITNRKRKTARIMRPGLTEEFKNIVYQLLSPSSSMRMSTRTFLKKRYLQNARLGLGIFNPTDVISETARQSSEVVHIKELLDILKTELEHEEPDETIVNGMSLASFLRFYREIVRRGGVLECFMLTAMDREIENEMDLETIVEEDEEDEEEEGIDSDWSDNERTIYRTRKIKRALLKGEPCAADCPEILMDDVWDTAWLQRVNVFFSFGLNRPEIDEVAELLTHLDYEGCSGENSIRDLHFLFANVGNLNPFLVDLWQSFCLQRVQCLIGVEQMGTWERCIDKTNNNSYIVFDNAKDILESIEEAIDLIACTGTTCMKTKSKTAFKSGVIHKLKKTRLTSLGVEMLYRSCKRTQAGEVMIDELSKDVVSFIRGTSEWNHIPKSDRRNPAGGRSGGRSARSKYTQLTRSDHTPSPKASNQPMGSAAFGMMPTAENTSRSMEGTNRHGTPFNENRDNRAGSHVQSRRPVIRNGSDTAEDGYDSSRQDMYSTLRSTNSEPKQAESYDRGSHFDEQDVLTSSLSMPSQGGPPHGGIMAPNAYPPWERTPPTILWNGGAHSTPQQGGFAHSTPQGGFGYRTMAMRAFDEWSTLTTHKSEIIMHVMELVNLLQNELHQTSKVLNYTVVTQTMPEEKYSQQELDIEMQLIYAVRTRLEEKSELVRAQLTRLIKVTSGWDPEMQHYLLMNTPLASERNCPRVADYFKTNLMNVLEFMRRHRDFTFSFDSMCNHSSSMPENVSHRKRFIKQLNEDIDRCIAWVYDMILSLVPSASFFNLIKFHISGYSLDRDFIVQSALTIKRLLEINECTAREAYLLTALVSLTNEDMIRGRNHLSMRLRKARDERTQIMDKLVLSNELKPLMAFLFALDRRDGNIAQFFQSERFMEMIPSEEEAESCRWHRKKLLRLAGDWKLQWLLYVTEHSIVIRSLMESVIRPMLSGSGATTPNRVSPQGWQSTPHEYSAFQTPSFAGGPGQPTYGMPHRGNPQAHPQWPSSQDHQPWPSNADHHPNGPQNHDLWPSSHSHVSHGSLGSSGTQQRNPPGVHFRKDRDPLASPTKSYMKNKISDHESDTTPTTPTALLEHLPSPKYQGILKQPYNSMHHDRSYGANYYGEGIQNLYGSTPTNPHGPNDAQMTPSPLQYGQGGYQPPGWYNQQRPGAPSQYQGLHQQQHGTFHGAHQRIPSHPNINPSLNVPPGYGADPHRRGSSTQSDRVRRSSVSGRSHEHSVHSRTNSGHSRSDDYASLFAK